MNDAGREGGREGGKEGGRKGGRGGGGEIGREEEGGVGEVRWERMRVRRGKGNGMIIIMYMYLISSSDVYIHCAQVWYSWLVLLEAIPTAWLPALSCAITIHRSVN